MHNVVGVRFKEVGKVYDFDPDGIELKEGDRVVIDSDKGLVIGKVVRENYETEADASLKKVVRKASEEDIKRLEKNEALTKETSDFCRIKIREMNLPMGLVGTELSFDGSKAIFYFTSEEKVDFRELVKELAAKFRIRIEMKQIGVRDEARLIGGYGCCGRALCCETFIKDFEPVSIRMAKKQELALNPAKISGVCGRLLCCLVFEYEMYDEIKKDNVELKNTEKPVSHEAGQDIGNSSESSVSRPRTEGAKNALPNNRPVKSQPNSSPPPAAEKGKTAEGAPNTDSTKRRRRRRRRKKRPEGSGPAEK